MMNFRAVSKNVFCPTLILGYSYLVTLKMGLGLMNPAPKSRKKEPNGCVCTPVYIGSRLLVQSGNCILAIACNNFYFLHFYTLNDFAKFSFFDNKCPNIITESISVKLTFEINSVSDSCCKCIIDCLVILFKHFVFEGTTDLLISQ